MFIIKIVRILLGYVRFTVQGAFPERFLNLVAKRRISIWNVRKRGDRMEASVIAKSYKPLREVAKRSSMRMRLVSKKGLPFTAHKYKKRKGILIGFFVFFAMLWGLSLFVWTIDITGLNELKEQEVRLALAEMGIEGGTLRSSVDTPVLEHQLMLKLPKISRVAVRQNGSFLEIEIRERTNAPEIVPANEPCNIVAAVTGEIVSIEVYEGQAAVKKGDNVHAGNLLVSGIVEDSAGNGSFAHARGRVIAKTERRIDVEVPFRQTVRELNGKAAVKRTLRLFFFDIPLGFGGAPDGEYEKSVSQRQLLNLPLAVKTERWGYVDLREVEFTEQEAAAQAEQKLQKIEQDELGNIVISDKSIEQKIENSALKLSVVYKCEENITVEQKIMLN